MRSRTAATPLALIVLAIGAAAYAYIIDRREVSDADRAARSRNVFPSFRVDQVVRIELEHAAERFVLERDADAGPGASPWTIEAHHRERADGAAVDMLLRELELAERVRAVAETSGMGLATPRVRGHVTLGPVEYQFSLGEEAPRPEGAAYMRVEGEGTFVVTRPLKVQLLRGTDAYRNHTLFSLGASDIARIDVRARDGGGFSLERRGDQFRLAGPRLRASRNATDHLFSVLADARADSFVDDMEAARATGDAIVARVVPHDASGPGLELRVGGVCPGQPDEVVVQRTSSLPQAAAHQQWPSTLSACTAKVIADAMSATQESLLDTAPLYARADEIEQIRLESVDIAGVVVELARKGTGWRERAPEGRDLDSDESESANTLAAALVRAQAVETPRPAADESFIVRSRVTVTRSGGGPSEVVELAAPGADGTTLARRLDDGAILRLPRAVARRFEPHPIALRPLEIWRPSWDAGAVVAIDDACASVPERLELRDGLWAMRAPSGFVADPQFVTDLVRTLAHAKADAWVAEGDDGAFGFDLPGSCTVALTVDSGAADAGTRRVSLIFGAEGDGGVYARTIGDAAVFVAPKMLRDLASHPAIDRNRLHIDPDALSSVTLVRDTASLTLERAGERLTRRGRAVIGSALSLRSSVRDPSSDAADEDGIEKALAGLYASAAVHTGPGGRDEGMARPTLEIVARLRVDAAGSAQERIVIGAPARVDAADVYFARASGIDATFAVPRRAVAAILDAW